ncbi:MAG: N-acetylglucosamine-6-phosphate deacetylase [Coriobacteriia bacterium]|nr:N-acetylglucosamine-6-phosphate deacetylase [Coriobacteriia bacterium]
MRTSEQHLDATLLISNGVVCTPVGEIANGYVAIAGNEVAYVGDAEPAVSPQCRQIDANGGYVLPGFVDLHVNGGGGRDITEGTREAVAGIVAGHLMCGTTGLLIAVTGPTEQVALDGLRNIGEVASGPPVGARLLGAHVEGPFVNPKRQGPVFRGFPDVTSPNVDAIVRLMDAAGGWLKIMTMAPELSGALDVIEWLVAHDVVSSIGHTEATYEEANRALDAGATYAAHLYNQMTPLTHREPGTVGALLGSDAVVEVVADGFHVHPGAIDVAIRCKGLHRVVLASDATEVVGTNLDHFILPVGEGLRVEVRDGRTWGPRGEIIGSVLQMNHAVRNMVRWFDLPLHAVVAAATTTPASVLGLEDRLGSLEAGKLADVAILDREFEVTHTLVVGAVVYERHAAGKDE